MTWQAGRRAASAPGQPARPHAGLPLPRAVGAATTAWAVARGRGPTTAARLHRHAGATLRPPPCRPSAPSGPLAPAASVSPACWRALPGHRASRCPWGTGRGRRRWQWLAAAWCAARLRQAPTVAAVTPRPQPMPGRATRTRSLCKALLTVAAAVRRSPKTGARGAAQGVSPGWQRQRRRVPLWARAVASALTFPPGVRLE